MSETEQICMQMPDSENCFLSLKNYKGYPFMFELLERSISQKMSLTDQELEICKSMFSARKLRKKQYLLQEGDVCKFQGFVTKGILRSFTVDEKGAEYILQFAPEEWWIADLSSYITGQPSVFNIEALEDCELLLPDKNSWDELLKKIPKLKHYFGS